MLTCRLATVDPTPGVAAPPHLASATMAQTTPSSATVGLPVDQMQDIGTATAEQDISSELDTSSATTTAAVDPASDTATAASLTTPSSATVGLPVDQIQDIGTATAEQDASSENVAPSAAECGNTPNSKFRALLLHLSPKPHISGQRSRKRKAECATNITSSPYKQMLVEKSSTAVAKLSKDGKTKGKSSKASASSKTRPTKRTKNASKKTKASTAVEKLSKDGKTKGKSSKVSASGKNMKQTVRVSTGPKTTKLKKSERCQGCGIMEGSSEDIELAEDWIACIGCGKWFHDSCAEENGLLDDEYFTCKTCTA